MITRWSHKVAIVGAGVSGTADAYNLSRYSNVQEIVMFEKCPGIAQINSHPLNNAQTSHEGDTETNYGLDHALEVQEKATNLRRYLVSKGKDPNLYQKRLRMVLAVGAEEVGQLEERFRLFKPHYPNIHLAYSDELRRIEPKVMEGRDPNEPICVIVSSEGFIVNYQEYAKDLFKDTVAMNPKFEFAFNTPIKEIEWFGDYYKITTHNSVYFAETVIFAAGAYSLYFAQRLGDGLNYGLLPVAGSFYSAGHLLNNKVYRVQIEGMPFAAIHGDPDILDMEDTRFGPTTKPLPLMERHHYDTFRDFMKLPLFSTAHGIYTLLKILKTNKLFGYALKNAIFDLPWIGPAAFLREVRPIIPTIKYSDLKLRRGAGGIRPQMVNLETQKLEMGESTILGKNIIYNTTPSPGASVSMANGHRDALQIVKFLGPDYWFDEERFQKELGKTA